MKNVDKNAQKAILEKTYITIDDVYRVLPIGRNYSTRIFKEIEEELRTNNIPLFETRPRVIPTEYLVKRYPQLKKI